MKKVRSIVLGVFAALLVLSLMPVSVFAFDNSGWIWPVPDSLYMSRGYSDGHKGLDIISTQERNEKVVAARAGTVIAVYEGCSMWDGYGKSHSSCNPVAHLTTGDIWGIRYYQDDGGTEVCNYGIGNGVIIDHGDGVWTEYSHMESVSVSVGQSVTGGYPIGTMGSYGNSTGRHLHFAIKTNSSMSSGYPNGTAVNSNPYGAEYIINGSWNGVDNIWYMRDTEPPVISETARYCVQDGIEGIKWDVTEENLEKTWCTIREYGQTEELEVDSEAILESENNGVYSYKQQVDLFNKNMEGIYYVKIYAKDQAGNMSVVQLEAPIFFYAIDKSCSGIYLVSKDEIAVHRAPYNTVNGQSTRIGTAYYGKRLQVAGSYTNSLGNEWYQLAGQAGYWIYAENVDWVWSLSGAIADTLYLWQHPKLYFINLQPLDASAFSGTQSLRAANTLTSGSVGDGTTISFSTRRIAPEEYLYDENSGVPLHTITFNGNGGFVEEAEMQFYEGNVYGAFPGAERFGYSFAGWFTAAEGGIRVLPSEVCTESMTLYAHWVESVTDSGTCGNDLTWTLREDGLLKIEGSGSMTSAPWQEYSLQILDIDLPEGLTSIYTRAFYGCEALRTITLPGTLETIGSRAFFGCTGITEMTIPDSVQTMEDGCLPVSLTKLTAPFVGRTRDVAEGSSSAVLRYLFGTASSAVANEYLYDDGKESSYYNPENLSTLILTDAVKIPRFAFYGMPKLTQVTLNEGITAIGRKAFQGCTGLPGITLPNSMTDIGTYAFANCSNLSGSMSIPTGVTAIDAYAFNNCSSLTDVVLPDTLETIGSRAFYGCTGITEMTIPDSVQTMEDGCLPVSLTKLTAPFVGRTRDVAEGSSSAVLRYLFGTASSAVANEYLYDDGKESSYYNPENLSTLILTDAVKIPRYAFYRMSQLTQVTLNEGIAAIGKRAFNNCTGLPGITLPSSMTDIGTYAFNNCTGLSGSMSIPAGVTAINAYAFNNCSSLTDVVFPDTLETIGSRAFYGCIGITEMTIPDSVQTMEEGCLPLSLTKLTTPFVGRIRDVTEGSNSSVLRYLFGIGSSGDGAAISQPYSDSQTGKYYNPANLSTLILTDAVKIPGYAFYGMPQLTQVTLNEGITVIGKRAFNGCTGFSEMYLPYTITSIASQAFQLCSSLTNVQYISSEVRDSVLSIESGNENLTGASWDYEVTSSISIPAAVTEIEEEAFSSSGAEQIVLHADVANAGSRGFSNNPALKVLLVEGSNTVLADDVLDGSDNVIVICRTDSLAEQWCAAHGVKYVAY